MTVQSSDLQKLAKLLGMVGSKHDGEAIAAARKADEMVKRIGATWENILVVPVVEDNVADHPAHCFDAQRLLQDGKGILTVFERKFLIGILSYKKLTEPQVKTLNGIRLKVHAGRGS